MSSTRRKSRARTLALTAALLSVGESIVAAAEAAPEYEVKAAMLYNFAKFVEWPQTAWKDAHAPLGICVAGSNPFGDSLEKVIDAQNYFGRPIRVQRVQNIPDLENCQMVFVARAEARRMTEILHATEGRPVLTVSDIDRFARDGGMIGFVTIENKIRFSVNPTRAAKAGVIISSKLLRLATTIEGAP